MTRPSQEFYDDSSQAVGLTHSPTTGAYSSPPVNSGGIAKRFREDEELIERNRDEDRKKRVAELLRQGKTIKQAEQQAWQEQQDPLLLRELKDHAGNKERFIKHLMRPAVSPQGHGGSKSGRRRSDKKGTYVCKDCHLEYCEHRPKRRGRPPKQGVARHERRHVRMLESTLAELHSLGLNPSDALALFAIAYRERRSLDDVISEWKYTTRLVSQRISAA